MSANEAIAQKARELGFMKMGRLRRGALRRLDFANRERNRLGNGRLIPLCTNPKEIMPDAKSLIVLALPFRPIVDYPEHCVRISAYYFANAAAARNLPELVSWMNARGYKAVAAGSLLKRSPSGPGLGAYSKNGIIKNKCFVNI